MAWHCGSQLLTRAVVSPGPPLEEHLAANTLWPEVHKLYGHGNNLYALAAHPSGRLLASACQVTQTLTSLSSVGSFDTFEVKHSHACRSFRYGHTRLPSAWLSTGERYSG